MSYLSLDVSLNLGGGCCSGRDLKEEERSDWLVLVFLGSQVVREKIGEAK